MIMSIKPDRQFSIRYTSYKGYRAVTLSGELYSVTTGDTIGVYVDFGLRTMDVWITNYRYLDFTSSSDHHT